MTESSKLSPELDAELDLFFDAAREAAPVPSSGLIARVLDDAQAVQNGFQSPAVTPQQSARPWWRQLFDDIGGLPAMGGLAASACVGVYLGFVNPDLPTSWSSTDTAEASIEEGVMSHALLGDLYWIEEG
ncbi:hypothetical protein [Litoreibacter janthinus]|uniref:Dihydroorotate dehydrogenase n=1 Tax=Litoreibacter janthinus TaxID=670154 RepID=A0A1I6HSS1_9RHOB|nr:hypothetical protein [Litoreibacter janthinus]SFR57474.1 hypothetical protein SAMN04488002_3375 [Litoreibacter janthinus]